MEPGQIFKFKWVLQVQLLSQIILIKVRWVCLVPWSTLPKENSLKMLQNSKTQLFRQTQLYLFPYQTPTINHNLLDSWTNSDKGSGLKEMTWLQRKKILLIQKMSLLSKLAISQQLLKKMKIKLFKWTHHKPPPEEVVETVATIIKEIKDHNVNLIQHTLEMQSLLSCNQIKKFPTWSKTIQSFFSMTQVNQVILYMITFSMVVSILLTLTLLNILTTHLKEQLKLNKLGKQLALTKHKCMLMARWLVTLMMYAWWLWRAISNTSLKKQM